MDQNEKVHTKKLKAATFVNQSTAGGGGPQDDAYRKGRAPWYGCLGLLVDVDPLATEETVTGSRRVTKLTTGKSLG